jgi:hypothetical protein
VGEQVVGIAFKKESVPENVDELFCAVCRERAPRTDNGQWQVLPADRPPNNLRMKVERLKAVTMPQGGVRKRLEPRLPWGLLPVHP